MLTVYAEALSPVGRFLIVFYALLFVCGAALAHDRKA